LDYSTSFTFSASEQEFFASKGFTNELGRCPDCRAARKQQLTAPDCKERAYYAPVLKSDDLGIVVT